MTAKIIPASPNWYCSQIVDSNSRGILVFGARHEIYVYDVGQLSPQFKGILTGHHQKVTALGLCEKISDRELCCSASEDGHVKLWQVDTREVVSEHSFHSSRVTALCWAQAQSDLIVTGDDSGSIGVWQFEDNRQTCHRPEKGCIQIMAPSPHNPSLVAVGYKAGQIVLVNVKNGAAVVARLRGHDEEVHSLAWCPVPGESFKPQRETTQDITDLETFGVEDSWRKKPPLIDKSGDFGEEGWMLASGSKDKTIRVWSTSKNRQLLMLKLPNPGRRGERSEEGGRGRLWLSLHWLKHEPYELVSASQSGDLLLWDISKTGKDRCQPLHSPGRGHSRMVFNICPAGEDSHVLCTVSMDRVVLLWDTRLKCQVASIATLGGFCYTVRVSPFDAGRVALGVGDAMIRLWNLNSPSPICDMNALWQGIKSKITALCWHPKKEGVLAYGTDEGRVGIYDTLSKKPPLISTTYHKRTVYVVAWGPSSVTEDATAGPSSYYSLYSCGDGVILEHNTAHLDKEAKAVSKMIQTVNPAYRNQTKIATQSEISFSPDYCYMAVGNDDGTVEIYCVPSFVLVATVQVMHKLINCISWHPHVTMDAPNGSKYDHCLAIGGNESGVCVVDLSKIYARSEGEVLHLVECLRKFEGHSNRITGLAWSPYAEDLLTSVSYDGKALVWNLGDGSVVACYRGHLGKLLSVQWNGLDPGEVITGGDDFSVHRWRVEDHGVPDGQLDPEGSKKDKKRKKKAALSAAKKPEPVVMATEDEKEITALLEAKKQELMLENNVEPTPTVEEETSEASVDVIDSTPGLPDINGYALPDSKGDNKARSHKQDYAPSKDKKRKARSMFPESNKRDNMRGRAFLLEDIETLTRLVYCTDANERIELGEDLAHLGLFLDRRAVYACLDLEGEHHRNNDNMEYFYQLEIWKGNINAVLRVARQRDELSDWLVAMAPMASYDTWTSVCEDYALQLEADGQYHKAATYFLACHKVYEAIKLFKRHKLFKEAIALAKVRLSPLDPALEELYTLWAQQLTKDGNYEQAAKCHLAMRQVQDAAKLLARRYDQSSLRTAAHISLLANEKHQGVMYTHKLVQQHLVAHEWSAAYASVRQQKELQVFLATSSIHEMLTAQLTRMKTLNVDTSLFTKWGSEKRSKTMLPDFILDPGDVDSLSPWQLQLVEGHTFPHHVLRTWYSQLDISMDTTNLEDMYKTLCLLHAGRQSQVDLPQVLIQVSMDLTLCLLSLMMSETPTAMSHLLQAVGSLHETGHVHVMQALMQLFLPQGPKYILKLQQEVTAMRVMISMDTHSHVDGASKVHTLKRYLSDLKDEDIVNSSSLRCRELDCLRAYYYVAILSFLKESYKDEPVPGTYVNKDELVPGKDVNKENLVPNTVSKDNSVPGTDVNKEPAADTKSTDDKTDNSDDINGNIATETNAVDEIDGSVDVGGEMKRGLPNPAVKEVYQSAKETKVIFGLDEENEEINIRHNSEVDKIECGNTGEKHDSELGVDVLSEHKLLAGEIISPAKDLCSDDTGGQSTKEPGVKPDSQIKRQHGAAGSPSSQSGCCADPGNQSSAPSPTPPVLNASHYSVTMSQLYQISQGLLWDLQAKRFALTETLGYIHKAISQLLLSKNPKQSETVVAIETTVPSGHRPGEQSDMPRNISDRSDIDARARGSNGLQDSQEPNPDLSAETGPSEAVGFASGSSGDSSALSGQASALDNHPHMCEHHTAEWNDGHMCHAALTHHFDHMLTAHTPQGTETTLLHSETEFKCSFFDVCSSCELLQKSRKILFEDEPHFLVRSDPGGLRDVTSVTNPAKYINVPDEWYSMPVDLKYFKPYITMATLKDEQEYVMSELKRGPDSTQAPFPNPLESMKALLDVCRYSRRISGVERKEYAQKAVTWALNFAVTSQQKQTFMNLLQTHMDT